jgi:hypothetical protein
MVAALLLLFPGERQRAAVGRWLQWSKPAHGRTPRSVSLSTFVGYSTSFFFAIL